MNVFSICLLFFNCSIYLTGFFSTSDFFSSIVECNLFSPIDNIHVEAIYIEFSEIMVAL